MGPDDDPDKTPTENIVPPPAAVRPPFSEDPFDNVDPMAAVTGLHPASRDFVRALNKKGLIGTAWALLVTVSSLVGATLWAYRAAAQEARDAGSSAAAEVKRQADATQRELERFQAEVNARLGRVEESGGRQEQKLDKMLERFQIPNPAPAPKDGGQ